MSTVEMESKYLEDAAYRVYRYMTKSEPDEWGAHRWADWAMNPNRWDWNPGVGVIAQLEYWKASRKPEVLHGLERWIRRNLEMSEQAKVINSMAPFAVFPDLYRLTGQKEYLDRAEAACDWMAREAPRTREGAFEHTVTENASFPEQVWADTVFMAVLCLARFAALTHNAFYAEEAVNQLKLHLDLLQDEETGVLFHGWNCAAEDHMSAARWTRANAWIVVATPMIMQEVAGLVDMPDAVIRRYIRLAEGVVKYPRIGGLWPTVLDRPGFYPETSGSAGIACGLFKLVRLGLLPKSYRAHAIDALRAVLGTISDNGEVRGVSGGTPVMTTVEDYNNIDRFPTLYGQGLTLMLLSEALMDSANSNEEGQR